MRNSWPHHPAIAIGLMRWSLLWVLLVIGGPPVWAHRVLNPHIE
jgi:hypothetical protein